MALIFGLSSISHPPDLPSGVSDKGGHAVLYCGLGALLMRALAGGFGRPVSARTALAAVVLSVLYGVTDEVHQHFVPPRRMEWLDLAADAAGASAAAVSLYIIGSAQRRRSRAAARGRSRGGSVRRRRI